MVVALLVLFRSVTGVVTLAVILVILGSAASGRVTLLMIFLILLRSVAGVVILVVTLVSLRSAAREGRTL